MKRIFLVLGMILLACSAFSRAGEKTSAPTAAEPTERENPAPTEAGDADDWDGVYVSPFCTLLGEGDTQTENYGNSFILNWGWKALTREQVLDYLENAITKVTVNGEEITDAQQGEVYQEDEEYHVFWYKNLGVLDRGKYTMTFFEKYRNKIFDGWDYFGPGTDNESVEDTCYLIVE
jgi:hypothetical protein